MEEKTSKYFQMIRKDGREIQAWESKFERSIGDKIIIDGQTFYVFQLHLSKHYAAHCNYLFDYDLHHANAQQVLKEKNIIIPDLKTKP